MPPSGFVTKRTLYLAVFVALILGFLSGVVYSVYRAPADDGHQRAEQNQEAKEVIASLEKATRDNPGDAQAWIQLGHAYFDTAMAKQAIAAYTKALELKPDDYDVMTDLGVMYHEDKQHQKALELFDRVLKGNPNHEQSRFNKGVVLLTGLNDRKGAIAQWKVLVQQNPMAATPSGKMVGDLIEQLEKEEQGKK